MNAAPPPPTSPTPSWRQRLLQQLRVEWQHLTTVQRSDRHWQVPLAATLAMGLPLLIGAWFKELGYGMLSSLGGMVFVHLPNTPMSHRMMLMMACAAGMAGCYALGVMGQILAPAAVVAVLSLIASLVTMVVRYYRIGPPGSLFFVMAAALGAYTPAPWQALPQSVGLVFLGALLAVLVAFGHSLLALRRQAAGPLPPPPEADFEFVVLEPVVIGACVGVSLAVAGALQLDRPYWVAVSCLAVIQGATLRAIWNKQLQRVLGTSVGLMLAWALLAPAHTPWSLAFTMMGLAFIIESLVVRHYGVAAVFITPMTLMLAEAAQLGHGLNVPALMQARFIDTVLGCLLGLLGGLCLHWPRFRAATGRGLRCFVPGRLRAAPKP